MGGTAVTRPTVDYRDVQGLVRFGYKHLKAARYAVVRVANLAAARAWLRQAPVTNAEYVQPPPSVGAARRPERGRTRRARRAGGGPRGVFAGVPGRHGRRAARTPPRRRGRQRPSRWGWGGGAGVPHLLVMFFTRGADTLDGFVARSTGPAFAEAFDVQQMLETSDLDGDRAVRLRRRHEPAGDRLGPGDRSGRAGRLDYSNVAALGEFLLGYANEYGKFTDRPVVQRGRGQCRAAGRRRRSRQ